MMADIQRVILFTPSKSYMWKYSSENMIVIGYDRNALEWHQSLPYFSVPNSKYFQSPRQSKTSSSTALKLQKYSVDNKEQGIIHTEVT